MSDLEFYTRIIVGGIFIGIVIWWFRKSIFSFLFFDNKPKVEQMGKLSKSDMRKWQRIHENLVKIAEERNGQEWPDDDSY